MSGSEEKNRSKQSNRRCAVVRVRERAGRKRGSDGVEAVTHHAVLSDVKRKVPRSEAEARTTQGESPA